MRRSGSEAGSATWQTSPMTPELAADPGPVTVTVPERHLHPAYLLMDATRTIRMLLPLIAVSIWRWPPWVLALIGAAVVALALARWSARRYSVAGGSLRVRSGLLRRSDETIPAARITALDAKRGLMQRALGVWELKVQTPGAHDRAAVTLHSLSSRRLAELRWALDPSGVGIVRTPSAVPATQSAEPDASDAVGAVPSASSADSREPVEIADADGRAGPPDPPAARAAPVLLAVLDTRSLLVAAVTDTSIPLILAGALAAWNRLKDVLPDRTMAWAQDEVFGQGQATLVILLVLLLLAVLTSITVTSLRLHGFTLVRDGDRLRTSRGLIAQRNGTIQVDRVQGVRLVEGLWRRMLGYTAIEVEVAGLGGPDQSDRMLFPLIRRNRAADLIGRALPEFGWCDGTLTRVPRRARRRYLTVPVLVALAVTAGALLLPGWGRLLAAAPIPLAVLIGLGQARDAGWRTDATTVTLRWRRILARHTVVARIHRVQITKVTVTILQRRAQLAGLRLLLSSRRSAKVKHLAAQDADLLQHTVGRRSLAPSINRPPPDPSS